MKESVTYQAILREGRAEGIAEGQADEARKILLLLGRTRFGEPSTQSLARLNRIADVHALEDMNLRLLDANSWDESLPPPGPKRRGSRRKRS